MLGSLISAGASLLGGVLGSKKQKSADEANVELQREFAQNGIRWKVEDAKAAGVSPLYALGAPTTTGFASYTSPDQSHWSAAGNSIQRAIESKQTNSERLQERLLNAQIDGQEIENATKRSHLALTTGAMKQPPLPASTSGVGDTLPAQVVLRGPYGDRLMSNPALSESRDNLPSEFVRQLFEDMVLNPIAQTKGYFKQEYNKWRGR